MPQKVYLDDNGEPVAAPKVYLDDHGNPIPAAAAPAVDRGGLRHPLTSMVAPELEGARSALETATEAPHGQPIMARSRTGTLYPSETGTGAVNAAKAAARGAGGAVLDQVEGLTSPLGLATAGAAKGASTLANSPSARATTGKVLQFIGDDLIDLRKPLKVVAKAGKWLGDTAAEAPEPPPPAASGAATGPTAALSDLEFAKAEVAAGRQPPGIIAALERAQQAPQKAPPGMMRGPLQPTGRPPITVSPESAMQPPADSPLLQPRVDIGAEKVGRMNGLSKIDVRNQTGPIRGETAGEAAGMPAKPRERILDKLIDMGPKGRGLPEAEREAYAAAGTSDKARLQVQAYLDALRKVGFVGAGAAAPALMRNKLVSGIEEQ